MEPKIPTSELIPLAACTADELKSWVRYGHVAVTPAEHGKARMWDAEDALHITVFTALVRAGVSPQHAGAVALHIQTVPHLFADNTECLVLVVAPTSAPEHPYLAKIVPANQPFPLILGDLQWNGCSPASAVVVDLSALVSRVESAFQNKLPAADRDTGNAG